MARGPLLKPEQNSQKRQSENIEEYTLVEQECSHTHVRQEIRLPFKSQITY